MDKLKLEPTSALAMHWMKNALQDIIVQKFIQHLDLSSGLELFNKCNSICDWYSEVIVNRKFFIAENVKKEIEESEGNNLIINLAAGKSPLALQLLEKYFDKIDMVLEIDISGMEIKKELYDKNFSEYSKKIKCINADITSPFILRSLNNLLHEYYKDHICIIVLEGISYYLTKSEIENIISSLISPDKNNFLFFEYLVPLSSIKKERQYIPQNIFDIIKDFTGLEYITSFNHENVEALFNKFEAELKINSNLYEVEKMRLGENNFFKSRDEGWIEFSVWKL